MLHDATGNRLFKKVDIKIVFPDKTLAVKAMHQHAPAKQGFSGDNIDEMLMNVADQLDKLYPWWSFKMVELTPLGRTARYNFVCTGFNKDFKMPTPSEVPSADKTPEAAKAV